MSENDGSISFYFFDIDDNLFFLPTKLYLWNAETQSEREVSSGDYTYIHDQLGRVGEWQAWSVREGFTYRDFRDAPDVVPSEQAFCKVLLEAVTSGMQWKGPSWPLLEHAARNQRPVVFITARGHAPETIAAGFDALADKGYLHSRLNILGIYTVSNPDVQKALGVTDPNTTVPSMKKMAIKAAVEMGLEKYGKTPPHRFGISDDDPNNVMLAINAMRDCKVKYPDKRFFVINTNKDHYVKLEVFPMDHPVTADAQGKKLLSKEEDG